MALAAGNRLGSYEVLAPLGAGGMGEVCRARDLRLGREVALKVIRPELAGDPARRQRFDREARLLASLNHPNVASLYYLDEADGVTFLVMELVAGETLAERLRRGPLPVPLALSVCAQAAAALEAAHERGVIHRDLKPANVKVTPKGQVKLLDFGLAKGFAVEEATGDPLQPTLSYDETGDGVVVGTPAYMSPEQARGQPLDKRTDVWSFGCLLYEVLAGRRAFARDTVSDTLAAVLEREPAWAALPPATPANVRELLQQCLRKDTGKRLGDVALARRVLERAARDPAPPAPTETVEDVLPAAPARRQEELPTVLPAGDATAVMPPPRPRKRRPSYWPWAVLAAVLGLPVLCCGGGAWYVPGWFSNLSLPGSPSRASVAVLPFGTGDVWGTSETDKFGEGMSAEVTRHLSQSPNLKVTPHSSAVKRRGDSAAWAARWLEVRWVVVGKMEVRGDTLELRVELVDAKSDTVTWTEVFTLKLKGPLRPEGEMKRWQEEKAKEIASKVRQRLAP